jgi:integrase
MKLNEDAIRALPPPPKGNRITYFPGATLQGTKTPGGFGVRVTANGARSFVLSYRTRRHEERRMTIGQWPTWSVLAAVKEARELRRAIDRGEDPLDDRRKQEAASRNTLRSLCEEYFSREGGKLRSAKPRRQALERLVLPTLGSRDITTIKRSDIVRLLDRVEDENGPVMATRLLAYVGKVFNWHASRSDDFRSPIVRGMARSNSKERARQRILSDDELRAVWAAAKTSTKVYGALVRFILLTACRPGEAAGMTRGELRGRSWVLPASRNKVKFDLLRPLSKQAAALLPGGDSRFVFSTARGASPRGNFAIALTQLHEASGTEGWSWHDLRRTARSLMSRAGVPTDHAERCLGHVIGGVRGIYDVYEYETEKAAAYEALAGLIERIVNPAGNVTALRGSLPRGRESAL